MSTGRVALLEDFDRCEEGASPSDDWWVEGGERVWIDGGHLRVKADPPGGRDPGYVCTVWHKRRLRGGLRLEFDAHVIDSTIDANNINLFLLYSDPSGVPLFETREARSGAGYDLYHDLDGYIFTFLNDTEGKSGRARFRMRRCPGFRLVAEAFDYHCRRGVTYHVSVTRQGGRLAYAVDGNVFLTWDDDHPLREGHIGLRTYRTDLWWDHIRVEELA